MMPCVRTWAFFFLNAEANLLQMAQHNSDDLRTTQMYWLSYIHSSCLSTSCSPHKASLCDIVLSKLLVRLDLSHCTVLFFVYFFFAVFA